MNKISQISVFVCLMCLLIVGANAQDKKEERKEIAKNTENKVEKNEVKFEATAEPFIGSDKEY